MAIPSRQIGWSTKANLLWQISKQLEYLTCVTAGGCGTTTTTTTSSVTNYNVAGCERMEYHVISYTSDTLSAGTIVNNDTPECWFIIDQTTEPADVGTVTYVWPALEECQPCIDSHTTTTTTTAPVYTFQSAFSDTSNSNACIDPNYEPIIYSLSENLSIGTQVFQDPLLEQAAFDGWYSVSGIVYHITGGNGFISELGTPCNDIIINVRNRFVDCPLPCPSACAEPQNYFDVYMTVACQQEFPNVGCAIWLNIEGTVAFPDGSYSNGNNGCIYIVDGLISSPPPTSEQYYVNDCSSEYGAFISTTYPIGTFVVNDMVTFTTGQGAGFGYIAEVTQSFGDDIGITAIGIEQGGNCVLSNVTFQPILIPNGNQIFLRLEGVNAGPNSLTSIGSNALNYNYYFDVYYQSDNGSGNISFEGNIPISNYNLSAEDSFNLGDFVVYNDIEEYFNYLTVSYVVTSVTFTNTTSYSNDGGCSYNYFLRTNDLTTFYCYTPNDQC